MQPVHPAEAVAPDGIVPAIAGFAALLRDHGLPVGVAEQRLMVLAAQRLPATLTLRDPSVLRGAWRAIACHQARDWRRWPELFERYWQPERLRGSTRVSGQTRPARSLEQQVQALHQRMAQEATDPASLPGRSQAGPDAAIDERMPSLDPDAAGLPRAHGGASRVEALHDRSSQMWLPQDLAHLERLAEDIARRLRRQLTRRWHGDPRGRRLDIRRTLRASLRHGGVPLEPAWRQPRRERPRVFVLVDVSRSMQTHAQLFLRIARAFVLALDARVFVFHTRLAEITSLLERDSAPVQEKINAVTAGFGGGTRIATSVADFARAHARAQLDRRSRVWILSDGFDADPAPRLAEELAALRARGARVAWLHPSPQPPRSAAIAQAAAHIERFIRLNSLSDLERAAQLLN